MAAAYGCAIFRNSRGMTYYKDIYLADSATALIRWDGGGGASSTSPDFFNAPEPIYLNDVCIVTGSAQTKLDVRRNNVSTGNILRQACHLSSVTFRPGLNVPFNQGDKITIAELA